MCGLPQSGKSSEAISMGIPIVNRDSIRKTLGGTIRYFKEEDRVTEIEHIMVESLFNAGHDEVVVDACHLKPAYRNNWSRFAKKREYDIHFYLIMTSLETCMARAKRRFPDEPKFPAIIRQMWEGSNLSGVRNMVDTKIPEKQSENWN
jgi:predicted kinase